MRRGRLSSSRNYILRCGVFLFGLTLSLITTAVAQECTDGNVLYKGECVQPCTSGERNAAGDCVEVKQHGDLTMRLTFPPDHIQNKCSSWVFVPGEMSWSRGLLGALYLIALLYCFLGIAIIADMFMGAIEMITSEKEEIIFDPHTNQETKITVTIWNETVANLTLLALGSSAPEILLSIFETVTTLGEAPGELGPATIVGSAAYNLLIISAVCMAVVERPKKIKQWGVFLITALASLFAYIWLFIVLTVWTADEVTIAEAVLTFAFFPLLVLLSWAQDRRWDFRREEGVRILGASASAGDMNDVSRRQSVGASTKSSNMTDTRKMIAEMLRDHKKTGRPANIENLAVNARRQENEHNPTRVNKGVYKINALRMIGGRGRVLKSATPPKTDKVSPQPSSRNSNDLFVHDADHPDTPPKLQSEGGHSSGTSGQMAVQSLASSTTDTPRSYDCVVQFSSPSYSVMENAGNCTICMERTGSLDKKVTVYYHTEAGTAKPGENYKETSGTASWEVGQAQVSVNIPIVDNVQYQPDQKFYLIMTYPTGGAGLGEIKKTEVTIIDDDMAGVLQFSSPTYETIESAGFVTLNVVREEGSSGNVTVAYSSRDGTANAGLDYANTSGVLNFAHGETVKTILIPIMDDVAYEKKEEFYVELSSPQGGATVGPLAACTVVVTSDEGVKHLVEKVMGAMHHQSDWHTRVETHSWAQQFRAAMVVGDPDDPAAAPPGHFDYFMHFLTFIWKVLFAIVPPTSYWNGWAAFLVSLMFIGLITAVVAEFAGTFGCLVGLKDSVTAITFVALGTSLPDTFASKQAADEEDYADAAIGNVTGSNSVNVFLGLGLPWVIGSVYWKAKGGVYAVPAGDLAFSVLIFSVCAIFALLCLFAKRFVPGLGGAELGGPGKYVFSTVFIILWMIYIVLSSLGAYGHISTEIM